MYVQQHYYKMTLLKKYSLTILGALIGAAAGFLYWHEVGCASGTCAITSSPVNSSLYGALMGALFANIFQNDKQN